MASKQVNYTDAQISSLREQFCVEKLSVETIALNMGKSVRSVVAKLAQLGLRSAANTTTAATNRVTKEDLVKSIADQLNLPYEQIEQLEKANKEALVLVLSAIALPREAE